MLMLRSDSRLHAQVWSMERKRLLLGIEAMIIQGWPREFLQGAALDSDDMSNHILNDLAGNSFSGGPFGAVLLALLVHFPIGLFDFDFGKADKDMRDVEQSVGDVLKDTLGRWAGMGFGASRRTLHFWIGWRIGWRQYRSLSISSAIVDE